MKLMKTLKTATIGLLAMAGVACAQTAMERIQSEGVIRVGMADSVPFQFKDVASGEWRGYNVDMANRMAEAMGVNLEIVDATWATLIPGLESDRWDIAFVDMFATPERAVKVMFSDAYFTTRQAVMGNANAGVATWDDLNQDGKSIVFLAGTADEQVARDKFPNAESRPMVAEGLGTVMLEVASGRADATVASELNLRLFMAKNPNAPVTIVEEGRGIDAQGFSYAVRPGDDHLLAFLNTWVRSAKATGLATEVESKWIDNFPE